MTFFVFADRLVVSLDERRVLTSQKVYHVTVAQDYVQFYPGKQKERYFSLRRSSQLFEAARCKKSPTIKGKQFLLKKDRERLPVKSELPITRFSFSR
jgi:hypothetical protein